jgi:hypothetical protein
MTSTLTSEDSSVSEEQLLQNQAMVLGKLRDARDALEKEAEAKLDDTETNRFGQERAKIHFYYINYQVEAYEEGTPDTFGRPELILESVLGRSEASHVLKGDMRINEFEKGIGAAFDIANRVPRLFSVGGKYHRLGIRHFDGMEPWDLDNIYAASAGHVKLVSHHINPGYLRNPKVDVRMLFTVDDDPEYTHSLDRFRSLTDQERRAFGKQSEYMFETSYSMINVHTGKSGSTVRCVAVYTPEYSNTEWKFIIPNVKDCSLNGNTELRGQMADVCQARIGRAWAQEQSWQVYLKETEVDQERIGLTLSTDPVGARAVFKLRDLQEGEGRRKALIHWVRSHNRRRSTGNHEAALTMVRQHLRGEMNFTWRGFECRIVPSFADQEAARRALGIAQPQTWIKTLAPQVDLLSALGDDWTFV